MWLIFEIRERKRMRCFILSCLVVLSCVPAAVPVPTKQPVVKKEKKKGKSQAGPVTIDFSPLGFRINQDFQFTLRVQAKDGKKRALIFEVGDGTGVEALLALVKAS